MSYLVTQAVVCAAIAYVLGLLVGLTAIRIWTLVFNRRQPVRPGDDAKGS